MSRIEEALRRAAARQADTEANLEERPEAPPQDDIALESLAREPFPIEMPRRPANVTQHSRGAEARAEATSPAWKAAPPPEVPPPSRDERPVMRFTPADKNLSSRLVSDSHVMPVSREQYRRLAGTLHHAQNTHGLKVVIVASAVQGEGKTLTSTNLALTFSESYQRRVLLIDADMRRPTLHTIFSVDNSAGLSDLTSASQEQLSVREVAPRLALLPSGPPTRDPMAGLTSDRMKRVIEEARAGFDWVIIDTPPVALMPDANLLSAMADGAVLVIKAASTPLDLVNRAVHALGRDRILGVVLNSAEPTHTGGYGYSSYYGDVAPPPVNTTR